MAIVKAIVGAEIRNLLVADAHLFYESRECWTRNLVHFHMCFVRLWSALCGSNINSLMFRHNLKLLSVWIEIVANFYHTEFPIANFNTPRIGINHTYSMAYSIIDY